MLGDFNAHIGSRDGGVKGVHMGREISMMLVESYFTFCQAMKQQCATAGLGSETFITRHGSTPSLGNWHCNDYVIMRQAHKRKCLDVSVMCGADCSKEHRMLRTKLVVGRRRYFRRCSGSASVMCLG